MTAELWRTAEATIGPSGGNDYVLTPTTHAQLYQSSAPEFARLLHRAATQIAAQEYERADSIALECQRVFRSSAGRANIAALLTACAGAVILVLALFDAPGAALLGVGIAGAVIGAFGAFLTHRLRQQNMLQRWMSSRAEAETQRQAYFERIVLAERPEGDAGIPLAILQLEYFRRFQLDVQMRYYDDKQRKSRRAADRTITYAAAATFFGALSTGVAGLLGSGNTDWAGLAALGILGTSLASYSAVREAIGQDARNAERYEQTRVALRDLYAHLDEVRDAVASGNFAALHEFVTAVHDDLALEHRQWLREAELAHNGIARLEQVLRGEEVTPDPRREPIPEAVETAATSGC